VRDILHRFGSLGTSVIAGPEKLAISEFSQKANGMTVQVGIIGVGIMGADHARTLSAHVPGARVHAIYDLDIGRAETIARECGAADIATTPEALINDKNIDAVLIASPDQTHAPLTLACLAAGKPALCEKPLAPTSHECLEVVAAETKLRRRLVQIGYMRRYDPPYVAMKAKWKSGDLGKPLIFHCVHRNVSAPPWFDSKMAIANSAVHEFDVARWILESDLIEASVFQPDATSEDAAVASVFLVLKNAAGQLVNIEVFNNAGYGYDVKGELVCEKGTVSLRAPVHNELNVARTNSTSIPEDWRPRFSDAYRLQDQAWIQSVRDGKPMATGASAWDGYAAAIVAEAGLKSLGEARTVAIEMAAKPSLYHL